MGGERMLCEEGALEGTVSLCFGYSTISLAWAPRGKVYVELCTTTLIRVFSWNLHSGTVTHVTGCFSFLPAGAM